MMNADAHAPPSPAPPPPIHNSSFIIHNFHLPTSRLIAWTALIGLPFTLVAATLPAVRAVAVAFLLTFAAIALADAVASRRRLHGLSVSLPDPVRLQKDRPAELDLRIHNTAARPLPLRIGLSLPSDFESAQALDARLPAAESSRVPWPCLPRRRGNFSLTCCHLETPSPLGLWSVRGTLPIAAELRVHPNLLDARKQVAALFLTRGRAGLRLQRASGRGRDFEKLREYVPGDSYDEIHWRASAKRGHPVTKVFQVERTQEVYVVIDSSRLMARSWGESGQRRDADSRSGSTLLERFITTGLILALAAQQQGDLYGLLTFSDRIERFVRARTGKSHYDACRDALHTLQPRSVTPDYEQLAAFIRMRLRKRCLLVVLTALDDPVLADSFTRSTEMIGRQHLILVNMLQPPGAAPLFSNDDVSTVDDLYERLGGHLLWHDLRELEKVLQRRGIAFRTVSEERMTLDIVTRYLDVKSRQLL